MTKNVPLPPHPKNPGLAPDAAVTVADRDSFPASDAPAATIVQGSRAVPPEEMMEPSTKPRGATTTLTRRFGDAEAAKLALESLVRSAPLARDGTEVTAAPAHELRVTVPEGDAARIRVLLAAL